MIGLVLSGKSEGKTDYRVRLLTGSVQVSDCVCVLKPVYGCVHVLCICVSLCVCK